MSTKTPELTKLAAELAETTRARDHARRSKARRKTPRHHHIRWIAHCQANIIPTGAPLVVRRVEGEGSTHWYSYHLCPEWSYLMRLRWGNHVQFCRLE